MTGVRVRLGARLGLEPQLERRARPYPIVTRRRGWVPRARRIFRRYLPAEILTYLIINFLWAGLSLWLVSTLVSRTRVFTDREGASGGRSAATPRAQYTVTGSDSRGRLGRRAY